MQCSSPFKLIDKLLRGFQVLNRLPGIVGGIVPLPLDQVFHLAFPCVPLGDHAFHLVLILSLLFLLLRLLFGISLGISFIVALNYLFILFLIKLVGAFFAWRAFR